MAPTAHIIAMIDTRSEANNPEYAFTRPKIPFDTKELIHITTILRRNPDRIKVKENISAKEADFDKYDIGRIENRSKTNAERIAEALSQ